MRKLVNNLHMHIYAMHNLHMHIYAMNICETKDADQLRGNREADQRLCFRYMVSTLSLLSESKISSL